MSVRAFFRAIKIEGTAPPYDTIHLKVLYPAKMSGENRESYQGMVPADSEKAPFPVVIFFNGFNCEAILYQWLAVQLATRSIVVVTFNFIAEYLPGAIGITPGVKMAMSAPNTYGTASTALTLPAILAELDRLQAEGILAGMLNLQQIILGGHSGGGRIALENANPRFYPQVAAAFSYGGHSAAPIMLGFEPYTILPLSSSVPMLIMGGTCDGVIANASKIYGLSNPSPTISVVRTFQEAIAGGRNDSYLMLLEGANHFSITYPSDTTASSSPFDFPATQPEDKIRSLIGETINLFIDAHVRHKPEALQALDTMLKSANPLIATFERK